MIKKTVNKRKYPKKPNAKADLLKRGSHIINQKGSFEFLLPQVNHFNRLLFHNLPTADVDELGKITKGGKIGQVKHFYIPSSKHKVLKLLFKEFEIPEDLFPDLIGAYVNMFFAACTATYSTEHQQKWDKGSLELSQAFDFLNLLESDKINISKLYLTYQDISIDENNPNNRKFGVDKTIKFESTLGVGLLEEALKNFKTIHNLNMFSSFNEVTPEKQKPFFGHKNELKSLQSYYAKVILQYLSRTLFHSLVELDTQQSDEIKKHSIMLNRKYSKRKRCLFTGKLMFIAGLLDKEEYEEDDEKIIDAIRKKANQ